MVSGTFKAGITNIRIYVCREKNCVHVQMDAHGYV